MNQLKQYAVKTYKERRVERELNKGWLNTQRSDRIVELLWETDPTLREYITYEEFKQVEVSVENEYFAILDHYVDFVLKFPDAAPIKVTMINYGPLANQYEVATRIIKTYGIVWGQSFNTFIEALGYAFEIWNNQYASDYYDYIGLK